MAREIAVSWSLRNHYSDDMRNDSHWDRVGTCLCTGREVFSVDYLRRMSFPESRLAKPRQMCKLCLRKAGES
jgi:hypothetical protein